MSKWIQELRPTLALAFPIMLGQIGQMLMGIADSMMLGRVGTVELAASAFVNAVFTLVLIGCIGLLQPGSVLVAREHGAGRPELCGRWQRHARALSWLAGGGLGLLLLAAIPFSHLFGQPTEVVAVMGPYFALIAVSLVPTLLFQADRQFAEAMGRPWEPLAILLGSAVLNVVLNWMLIYGRLGAPELGLTGAGVATLAARVVYVLVIRVWLRLLAEFEVAVAAARTERHPGAPRSGALRATGEDVARQAGAFPQRIRLFSRGGARDSRSGAAEWGGVVLRGRGLLLGGGDGGVAGRGAAGGASNRDLVRGAGLHGAAGTVARAGGADGARGGGGRHPAWPLLGPVVLTRAGAGGRGRVWGGGGRESVRPLALGAVVVTCATAATSTLCFVLGGETVAGWFVRDDPAVVALAARALVIVAFFQLFDGLQVVFAGALRGLTDVKVPLAAAFVAYWIVALPSGYVFGVRGGGGLEAIWIALAGGLAAATLGLGWRLRALTRPA